MKTERCVNCGRLIKYGAEEHLCLKCFHCETIFDAQVVKLKRDVWISVKVALFLCILATVVVVFTDLKYTNTVGLILYMYALLSVGFSIAGGVYNYLRLKETAKKELAERK